MTMNYESFEAAIADFYVSVAKLDPTVTPPIVGWKKTPQIFDKKSLQLFEAKLRSQKAIFIILLKFNNWHSKIASKNQE